MFRKPEKTFSCHFKPPASASSFEDARLVTLLELSLNFGQRLRGRMAERAREGERERDGNVLLSRCNWTKLELKTRTYCRPAAYLPT